MKDDRIYLLHTRDAIRHILEYTTEGKDAFLVDRKTQDAVVRNLQVIGEAIKQLSETVKHAHPDIPWKSIAGMRDKLIHDYFGINLEQSSPCRHERAPLNTAPHLIIEDSDGTSCPVTLEPKLLPGKAMGPG